VEVHFIYIYIYGDNMVKVTKHCLKGKGEGGKEGEWRR
jgi:hypothetical protein